MKTQVEKYHTAMAGEFLVAAQLHRNGLMASVSYGNAKKADVIVSSPDSLSAVVIEVKTSPEGAWRVGNRTPQACNKPWVFVHLPAIPTEPPEFFVMTQKDVHEILMPLEERYLEEFERIHGESHGKRQGFAKMEKAQAEPYRDNWATIFNLLLEPGYRELAQDEAAEAEALEWCEALIGDVGDEPW